MKTKHSNIINNFLTADQINVISMVIIIMISVILGLADNTATSIIS